MAGHGIEIPPVVLGVLTVVTLRAGQPEHPLLEERVAPVPQRECEAQSLLAVAEPGQSVLAPPVGLGPCVLVRQVLPGGTVSAVVLADRAPLPFAEIWPPLPPIPRCSLPLR
jgi:hypothetical protein